MSRLENITVEGYKSIREMSLDLKSLNVLIGANGAGKSNFISLFSMLRALVTEQLQFAVASRGGAETLFYFGTKNTERIKIELKFGNNGYKCILAPAVPDTVIFEEEICYFYKTSYGQPYNEYLGSGHKESKLREYSKPAPVVRHVYNAVKDWRVYHFHDTSYSALVRKTSKIDDNDKLRTDAANLAAFLYRLKSKHELQYRMIINTVRMVAPFFDDFILRPNPLNEGTIQLEWREKNSDTLLNAASLSDGTLRFICLATLLLQPTQFQPSAILIDEPELGLHPFAINVLASLLKSSSTKRQVIVSTQSVPLVNQFDVEDLIVVDREGGQSVFKRLEKNTIADWLTDYSLGELWEKNILGGRPSK
jgi:predicted ATPase